MFLSLPKNSVKGLRWWMAGLVFLATVINFIDRTTISVLAPVITAQLGLSNLAFASISTWFLVAYTASQGLSGRFYDHVGTKRGFTVSISVWATAAMAHVFARGLVSLSCFRFLLGIGEAGNWPGAAKVMAEWFPARQRALGMAIFNSGVSVGAVLAPPLIVWLQLNFGWRMTFLVTPVLSFIWLILWLLFYESPERHKAITPQEYALITQDRGSSSPAGSASWRRLLKHRQVWAIVLSRFVTDPVWWLYIIWLPLYLYNVRGFSLKQIGMFAWVPYVAAGAGSLTGGWVSGLLISRGWSTNKARKAVIALGMLLMSSGIMAASAHSAAGALTFIAIVMFGFQAWISNVQTVPSDFFPTDVVASVAGLGGVGAGIGAILFTLTTGYVVDHLHSYTPILVTAALLPLLGTTILFILGGPIRRLSLENREEIPTGKVVTCGTI
jgi:ACS family hexuronate transporter-like MFS transporter